MKNIKQKIVKWGGGKLTLTALVVVAVAATAAMYACTELVPNTKVMPAQALKTPVGQVEKLSPPPTLAPPYLPIHCSYPIGAFYDRCMPLNNVTNPVVGFTFTPQSMGQGSLMKMRLLSNYNQNGTPCDNDDTNGSATVCKFVTEVARSGNTIYFPVYGANSIASEFGISETTRYVTFLYTPYNDCGFTINVYKIKFANCTLR